MFKSSAFQIRDFMEGSVWEDIRNEMEAMRQSVRDSLETCKVRAEIYRFQGRAEVLRDLQLLPENMLAAMEEHEKSIRRERGEPKNEIDDILED
jgi:hypothetical protein